jgi:AcrR family transcriptional regulator
MSDRKNKKGEPRAPLTSDMALGAAVELADAEGIEALSMRRLAQALGVEAMSLYHHVRNKDAILDGMVDRVFSEIALPQAGQPWQAEIQQRCHSMREVLKRHRWALSLMESRKMPGPANLGHHNAMLACFLGAGFSLPMAGHAYAVIDAFVYGFVHTELHLPFENGPEVRATLGAMWAAMPAGQFEALKAFSLGHVLTPSYSYGSEFEFGLGLVLDGVERAKVAAG